MDLMAWMQSMASMVMMAKTLEIPRALKPKAEAKTLS
jgi:hypothetical protein